MALINKDSKLQEVILQEPTVIPVINRFGINIGVGDGSIESICDKHGLDTDFFLTILNTFINEEYFPENTLKSFKVSALVNYLTKTAMAYMRFQLPNIERHLNFLTTTSSGQNNLVLIQRFFNELKADLEKSIEYDLKHWFPQIIETQNCNTKDSILEIIPERNEAIEDKLHDLKNMFIVHLKGSDFDQNLCYAVVVAIIALEKDFRQNNRIRERILRPLCQTLINKQ